MNGRTSRVRQVTTHVVIKHHGRREIRITLPGRGPDGPTIYDRTLANDNVPRNSRLAPIDVDDPYSRAGERDRIMVMRNVRDDHLAVLHSRGRLDEAQYNAARRYQGDLERSQLGRMQTNFPRNVHVQGGKWAEPLTAGMRAAGRRLRKARESLDSERIRLLEDVLAGRVFPTGAAELDFRWTLDVLAFHYNLAGGTGRRKRAA